MVSYNLQSTTFVSLSQKLLGHFSSPLLNVLYIATILLIGFILLLGESIGCLNRTSTQDRVEILFNIGVVLFFVSLYLAIRSKLDELLKFLTIVSKATNVNDDLRSAALKLTTDRAASVMPKLVVTFACVLGIAIFSWCATPLFIQFDLDNKNFFLGPYLYQCADDGGNQFPLEFLCLNMNSVAKYIAVNTLHTLVVMWGCVVYAWAFIFIICICILVKANIQVLTERLQQLQESAYSRVLDGFLRIDLDVMAPELKVNLEAVGREEFVKIIIYYQYVHR